MPPAKQEAPEARISYFEERLPAYQRIAVRSLNNAILFVKYRLRQPFLELVDEHHQGVQNPKWTDENGNNVGRGGITVVGQRIPGQWGELGCKALTARHDRAFAAAVEKTLEIDLHDELLADAQAAAFQGNIRRAVLELAVACEVFVKRAFFRPGERSGQVYEALENKRMIDVRVLDLLDVGGTAALGQRFRDYDGAAYKDIDHLFRARNKVAHWGEAYFLDDAGRRHVVDIRLLSKWWGSIEKLIAWAK